MKLMHPDSNAEIETTPDFARHYLSQGWREIAADAPKGNASLEDWQQFAEAKGFTDDDIEGKTRDELRAALA